MSKVESKRSTRNKESEGISSKSYRRNDRSFWLHNQFRWL